MKRLRAWFRNHPKIHYWLHRVLLTVSGILVFKDDLLQAVGYIPDNALAPKIIGWTLAVAAFSKILLGAAVDPAAPEATIPKSEAITEQLPESEIVKGKSK